MKVSQVIKQLQEYQDKYGDIEVLSIPTDPDFKPTDDLNIDCFEETIDWQGNRAIKIYGYQ